MKIKFKNSKIPATSLSQVIDKNRQKINKVEIYPNLNSSIKNNKTLEQDEYGYELEESSGSNSQNYQENNYITTSLMNDKSNGEKINIQNMNNNEKEIKKEFISMPITKIKLNKKYKANQRNINNKNNDILCHKSLNNNGFINNKSNKEIIDNSDWNNPKINFDGISAVSKGNSYENNDNSNLIENNYFNSQKINNNDSLLKSENFGIINSINITKENQNINYVFLSQNITKNIPYSKINNQNQNNKEGFNFNSNKSNNSLYKEEINNNMKNNQNIIKNELKEKLKHEKTVNKEKKDDIEFLRHKDNNIFQDKNLSSIKDGNNQNNNSDLIIEFSKYKTENEKLKKSLIMENILTNDMKIELENLKNDKKNLEEEILKYKNESYILNQKVNEYEIKLQQSKNKEDNLKLNLNKQKNLYYEIQKEMNSLKEKNEDLIEINEKISKNKCIINIEEKSFEDYKNIIQEKNNIIKQLKNENLNLIKEMDLKEKRIEKLLENKEGNLYLNNNIKTNELEMYTIKASEANIEKMVDNSFEIIKEIVNSIKIYLNLITENYLKVFGTDKINLEILKDIIEKIKTDNNGNISINEKFKIINGFINIIKINIEKIVNHINNNYQNKENNKNENSLKNNNLFASPNGLNNETEKNPKSNIGKRNNITRINSYNRKYISNDIFRKIDLTLSRFYTNTSENNRILKYNNRFKAINSKMTNNALSPNNTINLQSNYLEKNSVIYKSNLSPLNNKDSFIHPSNSKIINKKYDDLVDSIFNENKIRRKNNLSLKVKELTELINNQNSKNINNNIRNLFIKNIKKPKINLSDENDNNKTNIYPSNSTINNKNEAFLSLRNLNTKRRKQQIERDLIYKSTIEGNSKKNINSPFSKLSIVSNYISNNHKKTISTSNNYINRNIYINNIENIDLGKKITQNKNNIQNDKTNTIILESHRLINISSSNNENSFNKIGNNSSSFFEAMKNNNNKNHKKRLNKKFLMKHKILEKENNNNYDINGLANEVMKPSFLKINNTDK